MPLGLYDGDWWGVLGTTMKDLFTRRMIALTIPLTFALVLIGAGLRDRVLDPVVSGGLIAILGAVVALFAGKEDKDKEEDKSKKG